MNTQSLTVKLSDRSCPILIGEGIRADLPAHLTRQFPRSRFVIVTNTTLAGLYAKLLASWKSALHATVVTMPDGEQHKTVRTWSTILDELFAARLERSSVLIAFGGGVVGDVAGFAAASFLRGIDYVQVPTTLLAMVDSSVGGKTAVDHPAGKNLIGAFHQPRSVLVDTGFLETLPPREFVAGYAELFKYAFIGGAPMFSFVNKHYDELLAGRQEVLVEGIRRSLAIKARVVAADEHETTGVRALLNFGHTFAHALEKCFNFRGILHGEAVIVGMACACDLGRRIGTIPAKALPEYEEILWGLPPTTLPGACDPAAIHDAMFSDKKVAGGALRFVLPTVPGSSIVTADVPKKAVMATLRAVFCEKTLSARFR